MGTSALGMVAGVALAAPVLYMRGSGRVSFCGQHVATAGPGPARGRAAPADLEGPQPLAPILRGAAGAEHRRPHAWNAHSKAAMYVTVQDRAAGEIGADRQELV